MKISVLLFGIATDLLNTSSFELEVVENISVGKLKLLLQEEYPQLTKINTYAIAVNESYATDETTLKEKDVVAIIPPVSGG